jgi:hypothetical protein
MPLMLLEVDTGVKSVLPASLTGAAAADDDELLLVNAEKMQLLLDADAEA